MKIYILLVILSIFLICCNEPRVKQNSEILISFSMINENNISIDGDTIPSGSQKLKIIVGENWLWPTIDDSLIGMKKNEVKTLLLPSDFMYKNHGVYYLDNKDTAYIIKPNENLTLTIKILEIK